MNSVTHPEGKLKTVGVFYDGNYFFHVSNYYLYQHYRKARISISGLHQFIVAKLAEMEESEIRYCRIVDAHFFRGRRSAPIAQSLNSIYGDRVFDDILMHEGVISHYLPLSPNGEKGIDVWLALEAYELARYKKFDVSVLIASDGDYVPLIKKLHSIGTRVMVLGWNFSFMDENQQKKVTKTSQSLLDEATYPILMDTVIDDESQNEDQLIHNLFVKSNSVTPRPNYNRERSEHRQRGTIYSTLDGFGFIQPDNGGNTLFFYYGDVEDIDFNDLNKNDRVNFTLGKNEKGPCARGIKLCED